MIAQTAVHDACQVLLIIGLFFVALGLERLWDHFDRVIPKDL